jgi:hypothetical protein
MSTEEVATRFDGPVVIAISETDPGDMGEPRSFTSDGVTYLTVPPSKAWGWAEDLAEMKVTFDLRWKADMRAIKMWQAAHPGHELVWPDHADMVVWALGEIQRLRESLTRIWEEAYDCQSEDRWGTYPASLFRVIGEEVTNLGLTGAKS